jgi:hypothetical protein
MPRPLWKPIAFAACLAALPPPVLHAALAAAAGTLFEAAPFVLVAEALAQGRLAVLGRFVQLAGCGCDGALPGALSLPATALAWLAFGPAVALGRFAVALAAGSAVAFRRAGVCAGHATARETCEPPDAFAELAALAAAGGAASVAVAGMRDQAAVWHAWGWGGASVAFGAGVLLGRLVPCATAGVALAAGLAGPLPAAAAGLLASAGLLPRLPRRRPPPEAARGTGVASLMLAGALLALAALGPSGLVNPRLVPLCATAAVCAGVRYRSRTTRSPAATLLPALMAAALLVRVPEPPYRLDATEAAAAFPGSRLTFSGVALRAHGTTVVERFAIACCRLDAAPLVVTLERSLPVDGGWVTVEGTVVRDASGASVLRTSHWRRTLAPADPFLYR